MRQISVGSLCTEFTELLKKHSYSSDSLRRYSKAFDEFTEYAGERPYSQQLGAEFLAQKFEAVGGFVEEGLYAKDEMYFSGRCVHSQNTITSGCCSEGRIYMGRLSGQGHSGMY